MYKINKTNPPVDWPTLTSFELRYGLTMPISYREFILDANGGIPTTPAFPIQGPANNPVGVIQAFFGFNATFHSHDLDAIMKELAGLIPSQLLPIACTDGDDFLCIDLRESGNPVLFWDRRSFWGRNLWNEIDLYFVSGDFEKLLGELSEYPRRQR